MGRRQACASVAVVDIRGQIAGITDRTVAHLLRLWMIRTAGGNHEGAVSRELNDGTSQHLDPSRLTAFGRGIVTSTITTCAGTPQLDRAGTGASKGNFPHNSPLPIVGHAVRDAVPPHQRAEQRVD